MANPSNNSVLRSQEFYRLKQTIRSPGDIFEIDVSTKAIYIGPDSDISEVALQYYNPDLPDAIETAVVAVNGPFVGRLDAMLASKIPTLNQPGRLLVSPVDIVDPTYSFDLFTPQREEHIPVTLDLMASLTPLPDIPAVRADRTLRLPSVPWTMGRTVDDDGDNGSTSLFIPIYGRRTVTVTITAALFAHVEVCLINLEPGTHANPRSLGYLNVNSLHSPLPDTKTFVLRASDAARNGYVLDDNGDATSWYTESDELQEPTHGGSSIPPVSYVQPRGVADLLLLNIGPNPGDSPGPNELTYVDLFLKLSDREV